MSLEPGRLNPTIWTNNFADLDTNGKVQAEYVWIGGTGNDLRCKSRTLNSVPKSVDDLPEWNYDGSSTGQAPGDDSEVILKPCRIFRDPFRGGNHVMVMCDCYTPQGEPIPTNKRAPAKALFDQALDLAPWYGMEQEYTMFYEDGKIPFGWPKDGSEPGAQGPYYCSAGADNAFGRPIVEAHYRACLYAGVTISGINGEVMPGQWEYQVGPCEGIALGDELYMSRYILLRVAEMYGVVISFDPKPIPGDWNGAGMHSNFSTKPMREDGGYKIIIDAIERLGKKHKEHIAAYGEGNDRRLTGKHETATIEKFSYGVANRGASVRIPRTTEAAQKGYFEDRRPASNACGYTVSSLIFKTCCLDK